MNKVQSKLIFSEIRFKFTTIIKIKNKRKNLKNPDANIPTYQHRDFQQQIINFQTLILTAHAPEKDKHPKNNHHKNQYYNLLQHFRGFSS